MPAKSKRGSRKIRLNNKLSSVEVGALPSDVSESARGATSGNPVSKTVSGSPPSRPYILSEIKWIGLVTVIVVIALIILYIVFH